jgi:hypothetical protein
MRDQKWIENNFLKIKLTEESLAVYTVRKSLFKAIEHVVREFEGTLLDVGCGQMPYKEYIQKMNIQ